MYGTMASDTFINLNNKRSLWLWSHDEWMSKKPRRSIGAAIPMEWANDLMGIDESDEDMERTVILPKNTSVAYEKQHTRTFMATAKRNHFNLIILSECSCKTDKKIFHHPDYSRPDQVMKLCQKCHGKEHAKQNRLDRQLLIAMIALKLILPQTMDSLTVPWGDGGEQYPRLERPTITQREHGQANKVHDTP